MKSIRRTLLGDARGAHVSAKAQVTTSSSHRSKTAGRRKTSSPRASMPRTEAGSRAGGYAAGKARRKQQNLKRGKR